jgi:hypothetical protein
MLLVYPLAITTSVCTLIFGYPYIAEDDSMYVYLDGSFFFIGKVCQQLKYPQVGD